MSTPSCNHYLAAEDPTPPRPLCALLSLSRSGVGLAPTLLLDRLKLHLLLPLSRRFSASSSRSSRLFSITHHIAASRRTRSSPACSASAQLGENGLSSPYGWPS